MFFSKYTYQPAYPDTISNVELGLTKTVVFESERKKGYFDLRRKRILPNRGIFRLLIPRVKIKAKIENNLLTYRIKPDGLAWVFLVLCAGGIFTEFTMDRVKYPRDYPAEFIYGMLVYFLSMLIFEMQKSKRVFKHLIEAKRD